MNVPRDVLFEHLLKHRELISYRSSYELAFGQLKAPWLNQPHTQKVLRWADSGPWRQVGGVTVRLDALIVDAKTHRPSEGHFKTHHGYGPDQWDAAFSRWALCEHEVIVSGDEDSSR